MRRPHSSDSRSNGVTRREVLRWGAFGLSVPSLFALRSLSGANELKVVSAERGFGQAKSCIVLFAWGGMSHLDSWDMKPEAASNIRSAFRPIATRTPGYS